MAHSQPMNDVERINRFNRWCVTGGLLFLLLTIGAKMAWYEHRGLPQYQDYPQYYMGGVIAQAGAWDSLYPVPIPGAKINAGGVEYSTLRPRYKELGDQHGVSPNSVRFMQPPPFALMCYPLAFLPFHFSFYVWTLLLILAAWGVARQAGTIYQILLARPTRFAGILTLLICCSPTAHRWVRVGNISAIIAFLLGYVVLEMLRRDSYRTGIVMAGGFFAKYTHAVLGPMLIVLGRWKSIAWGAGIAVVFLAITLSITGIEPFKTFQNEIAPTLGRTALIGENSSLEVVWLRLRGITTEDGMPSMEHKLFTALRFGSILLLLALIFTRGRKFWENPSHVFAGCLALICWILMFSPIFWEHYHAYLAPFWGWLIWLLHRSKFRGVIGIIAICFAILPTSLVASQLHLPQLPEPLFSHLFWSALLMFLLAVWELLSRQAVIGEV